MKYTKRRVCDKIKEKSLLCYEPTSLNILHPSLDTPLSDDDSLTLADTVQADFSLENETIDKIHAEHSKSKLWGIVVAKKRGVRFGRPESNIPVRNGNLFITDMFGNI